MTKATKKSSSAVTVFRTWEGLNAALQDVKTSGDALKMIRAEGLGPNRPTFVKRIFSRYQRLRRQEDMLLLGDQIKLFNKGK
jgi:hypothetical protein